VAEAWDRGASEVCLQGGIHPDFSGSTYLEILRACKQAAPGIHVHAFSPLEVSHGAATLGIPTAEFLSQLREAGLGSLPGTAAEVLTDRVRDIICPDKLSTSEWLDVVGAAHRVGLRTTSTIMFGHVDTADDWAQHLLALRCAAWAAGMVLLHCALMPASRAFHAVPCDPDMRWTTSLVTPRAKFRVRLRPGSISFAGICSRRLVASQSLCRCPSCTWGPRFSARAARAGGRRCERRCSCMRPRG
jgi:Radical SAM superfamily